MKRADNTAFTDEELRAAYQRRASGRPRPDLRERINRAIRSAPEQRAFTLIPGTARRRPFLARFTAIAVVATALILAPLAGAGPGIWQKLDAQLRQPSPEQSAVAAIAAADRDEDDEGDDEDDDDDEDEDDEGDDDD